MKKIIALLLTATMTLSFTGCGGSASGENNTGGAAPTGETLNLFVWTEYVPQNVIDDFTKETGIKVNVSTYSSNEDMLAKVKAESEGAFDIIQPSDYMVEQCISQGIVQEIDFSKIPNFSNIAESYKKPAYDPEGKYSVPYLGGLGGIAVNTSRITDEITSYADLFKPDYAGQLVVLDDFRPVIGIASESLGYDLNETDPEKLAEVKEQVMKLKNNIKLYDSDSPKSALIAGECNLGFCWSAEIALANAENPDIEIAFPDEGAFLFLDNWCITSGSKNVDAAHKFIDYMCRPEVMQKVLEEFPYLCPNEAAVELMGEEYTSNPAKNPPAEVIEKGSYNTNLDNDTIAIYDEIWTELKK